MKKAINKKVLGNSNSVDDRLKKTRSINFLEKNSESKRSGNTQPQREQKKRFIISELPDCWVAHDIDDHTSGFLLYDKISGKYHASLSELKLHFPQLAKGGYKKTCDSPIDQLHMPKGELLLLFALRKRFEKNHISDDAVASNWRMLAIRQLSKELQETTGKAISEASLKIWEDISRDESRFEKYIGEWLIMKIQDEGAGDFLIRIGTWINKIAHMESFPVDNRYGEFFNSVEIAAQNAGGVPTQKAVRSIFENEFSNPQLIAGSTFDSLMERLCFSWLPAGGRGKNRK